MDPACSMGPSLPITRPLATASALPMTCGGRAGREQAWLLVWHWLHTPLTLLLQAGTPWRRRS